MSSESAERGETVLVVDDNLQNRDVAEGHLVAAGYRAVLADGGAAALVAFQAQRPDLVLLDVLMPGMDGFETCRRLRALPGGDDTPIVFLTALGDLATHKLALDSGADDFLTKPINRTELLIRLRSLLRIRRLAEEQRRSTDVIRAQRDRLLEVHRQNRQLAALMVHDLKNPLSSILSNVQFLTQSDAIAATDRESLVDVLRASRSMFRMVMNLLDISRSEDGALVPHWGAFGLSALLNEVGSEMAHRLDDKEQTLTVTVAPAVDEIVADRDMLRRVVENLLDNACKYSPRRARIAIEVVPSPPRAGDAGTAAVELRVRDDGEGVPTAERGRIFEPYVRVDGGGVPRPPEARAGHGLGLLFCRRAVEVHGGEIWVEDNPPRGSCFCVRLQRAPSVPAQAAPPPPPAADATVPAPPAAIDAAAPTRPAVAPTA
jgi:signal transduction histidine kinase